MLSDFESSDAEEPSTTASQTSKSSMQTVKFERPTAQYSEVTNGSQKVAKSNRNSPLTLISCLETGSGQQTALRNNQVTRSSQNAEMPIPVEKSHKQKSERSSPHQQQQQHAERRGSHLVTNANSDGSRTVPISPAIRVDQHPMLVSPSSGTTQSNLVSSQVNDSRLNQSTSAFGMQQVPSGMSIGQHSTTFLVPMTSNPSAKPLIIANSTNSQAGSIGNRQYWESTNNSAYYSAAASLAGLSSNGTTAFITSSPSGQSSQQHQEFGITNGNGTVLAANLLLRPASMGPSSRQQLIQLTPLANNGNHTAGSQLNPAQIQYILPMLQTFPLNTGNDLHQQQLARIVHMTLPGGILHNVNMGGNVSQQQLLSMLNNNRPGMNNQNLEVLHNNANVAVEAVNSSYGNEQVGDMINGNRSAFHRCSLSTNTSKTSADATTVRSILNSGFSPANQQPQVKTINFTETACGSDSPLSSAVSKEPVAEKRNSPAPTVCKPVPLSAPPYFRPEFPQLSSGQGGTLDEDDDSSFAERLILSDDSNAKKDKIDLSDKSEPKQFVLAPTPAQLGIAPGQTRRNSRMSSGHDSLTPGWSPFGSPTSTTSSTTPVLVNPEVSQFKTPSCTASTNTVAPSHAELLKLPESAEGRNSQPSEADVFSIIPLERHSPVQKELTIITDDVAYHQDHSQLSGPIEEDQQRTKAKFPVSILKSTPEIQLPSELKSPTKIFKRQDEVMDK